MATGTVKVIFPERLFGFLKIEEPEGRNLSDAVFFHGRSCQSLESFRNLRKGSRVSCRLEASDRGADRLKAVDVVQLDQAKAA